MDYLLRDGLEISDDISWERNGPSHKARVVVETRRADIDIVMHLTISRVFPGKYSYSVVLASGQMLRRLDVRGSHVNARDAEPGTWNSRTHKHRYTDRVGARDAYTPSDIHVGTEDNPGSPGNPDDSAEYETVFRAFCAECGIDFVGDWCDPDLGGADDMVLGVA